MANTGKAPITTGRSAKGTRSKPKNKARNRRREAEDEEEDERYRTLYGKGVDAVRVAIAALDPTYEHIGTSMKHRGSYGRRAIEGTGTLAEVNDTGCIEHEAAKKLVSAIDRLCDEDERDWHALAHVDAARADLTRALVGPHVIAREVTAARAGLGEKNGALYDLLANVEKALEKATGDDHRRGRPRGLAAMDRIWLAAGYALRCVLHPFGRDGAAEDDGDFIRLLPSSGVMTLATVDSLPLPGHEPKGSWVDHGKTPGVVVGFQPHEQPKDAPK